MAANTRTTTNTPMGEINTTPLIDVMLVLLVMFIITIPVATHSTDFDIGVHEGPPLDLDPVLNRLTITRSDELRWNSNPVSEAGLAALLKQTKTMVPEPQLQYGPDGQASYEKAARVTAIIKQSGVTNFGFVGNEQYAGLD